MSKISHVQMISKSRRRDHYVKIRPGDRDGGFNSSKLFIIDTATYLGSTVWLMSRTESSIATSG